MTIYIDHARIPYHSMRMNHMMGTDDAELDRFARELGLHRWWKDEDHYDVCEAKRALAIAKGAVPVDARDIALLRRYRRDKGKLPDSLERARRWWAAQWVIMKREREAKGAKA